MFSSLTVLAPGLLGGSVALAARTRGLAARIHVWARRPETRASIAGLEWCDAVHADATEAVREAELVVVCTPVEHIVPTIEAVAGAVAPGAIVTDVGSVKGAIVRHAAAALRGRACFIGSHPMAGSDRTGHAHAEAGLFRGRPCFVTPLEGDAPEAVARVSGFWRALEAVVVHENPERHDEIVAHLSHLPHALASVLCALLAARDPSWRSLAGPGLADATRIAASDPDLWRGIFELNRDEVLRAIRAFQDELQGFQAALANGDLATVRATLEHGRLFRASLRRQPHGSS